MKILNYGSLNIDLVYRVDHIVAPGETISSASFETFAGGKGANQSAALARAGAPVYHAGKVGEDGKWLIEKLQSLGVNTDFTRTAGAPTGHAVIQVDDNGENAILLFPGANHQVFRDEIDGTLQHFEPGDILLLQNEISEIPYLINAAHARGLRVCLNPAPMSDGVLQYPLDKVDILIVNETEGAGLAGVEGADAVLNALAGRFPRCEVVLTLGAEGARVKAFGRDVSMPGLRVEAVDTTGAGDAFIGYYLARRLENRDVESSLGIACRAAAISVTRPGATDSIPTMNEVENGSCAKPGERATNACHRGRTRTPD